MAKKIDYKFWIGTSISATLVIILIIALVGLQKGWFNDLFSLNIVNTNIKEALNTAPSTTNIDCSLDIYPNSIISGDVVTGTLIDGKNTFCQVYGYMEGDDTWRLVWEGTTDANGRITHGENMYTEGIFHFRAICDKNNNGIDANDCITNEEVVAVNPAPASGDEVGDNVGSGSNGGGSANFGDDITTSPINIDWTPGGPYVLGVKIWRTWSYKNPQDPECDLPEQYPVEWSLYDSNGMAWYVMDYFPADNFYDEVCPVTYHPDAPWSFVVSSGISCEIDYTWRIQPYICEEL